MANIEELLNLESDGGCAVCGNRDPRVLTVHHLDGRKPKNESYDNKLLLCHNCHCSHHESKGPTAEDLRKIKRRLIIKNLTLPGLNALKEAYRRSPVHAMPFLVNHLVEFGYLSLVEELATREDPGEPVAVLEASYTITPAGMALLEKWDLK